jgi:membrane protein DedA with SNARE-associated domain
MSFAGFSGPLAYLAILIAAIIEGEIAYVAASALVAQGQLNAIAVIIAGTIGAAIGDQAYFYVFRGRLHRWVARFPTLERRTRPLINRVRRNDSAMVLLIRFAPGLRVAIAAACAYAEVSPLKFTVLNTITAFIWAVLLLVLVAWVGPTYLASFGLSGWKGAALMGLLIVIGFKVAGFIEGRAVDHTPAGPDVPEHL